MRLVALMLALLCLCGCVNFAAVLPTPTFMPVEEASVTGPVSLPLELDPLGFFHNTAKHGLSSAELAEAYDAQIQTMPNVYEIPNYYLGDYDARTLIWTYKGRVMQVTTQQLDENNEAKRAVYKTMVQALGQPDGTYRINSFVDFVGIPSSELFYGLDATCARWHIDDRTIEIGEVIRGNHVERWYIAVYQDRLDYSAMFGFDFPCAACPHGEDVLFDPTGIYMDDELFSLAAETIISRYGAEEVPAGARAMQAADDSINYSYVVEGLEVLGYDAYFTIDDYEDGEVYGGSYWMELDCDIPNDEARRLFLNLAESIDQSTGGQKSYEGLLAQEPEAMYDEDTYRQGDFSIEWDIQDGRRISLHYRRMESYWSYGSFRPEICRVVISLPY